MNNMNILENVYIINLDDRKDRILFMKHKLEELGIKFTRIPAVLGSNHSDEYNNYIKQFNKSELLLINKGIGGVNSLGAYGLLLTYKLHIAPLYKRNQHITIFEDDVFFHKHFSNLINRYYNDIIDNDVVWLGCQQIRWTDNMLKEINSKGYYNCPHSYAPYGTYGMVYSSRFLKILDYELKEIVDTKDMVNIDNFLSILLKKYGYLKSVCIYPNLVLPQVYESDNMGPRDIQKMWKDRKWDLSLYKYSKTTALFSSMYKNKIINNEVLDEIDEITLKNLITEKPISNPDNYVRRPIRFSNCGVSTPPRKDGTLFSIFFNSPIFAMNLKDRKIKKMKCISQLENINVNYNIVESINTLDYDILPGSYRKAGEIGYVLTITSIIKDFLTNYNDEYLVVFDDDIMFDKKFKEKLLKYGHKLCDFDVLYLGASEWSDLNFDNVIDYYIPNTNRTEHGDGTCGSFANIYKRSFLKKFYNYLIIQNDAFDRVLLKYLSINNFKSYVLYPNLVVPSIIDSDIRSDSEEKINKRLKRMRWYYENYNDSNDMPPLFSFAIITRNRCKFLPNTIDNILDQVVENTKLSTNSYEIIILDDASTDSTEKIISSYTSKVSNIHFYKNKVQSGIPYSRNTINTLCNGKYIIVTDDDDIIFPNRVESILSKLSYNDGKFAGTNSGWINFNLPQNKLGTFEPGGLMTPETLLFSGKIAMHPVICYRKDVITKITYPKDIPFNSDYAVLSEIVCNGYNFINTNSYNIIKIDHNECVTNTKPQINYAYIYREKLLYLFFNAPKFELEKIQPGYSSSKYLQQRCNTIKNNNVYTPHKPDISFIQKLVKQYKKTYNLQ